MAARKLKPAEPEKPKNDQPAGDTSWKNGVPESGWYKYPDAWWRDLPRLQRGLYQRMLIEYVWGATVPRRKGEAMAEKSPWLSYVEMAAVFRCSPEQVRDDARDAAKRGLLVVEEPGSRGKVRFQVCWERWPNLKDYVAPAPKILKKERVAPSSRWLAGVSVRPGGSYDFTVPELPADFRLQRISLRNTGDSGEVVFAGGGPAEGGILVLEAQSNAGNEPIESTRSGIERESTPAGRRGVRGAGRVDKPAERVLDQSGTSPTNPVSRNGSKKDGSVRLSGPDEISQTATLSECVRLLSARGRVNQSVFMAWFRNQSLTADQVLEAVRVIVPSESAKDPIAWILSRVPGCVDGSYDPHATAKKISARDKRIADAFRMSRDIKEGKIA